MCTYLKNNFNNLIIGFEKNIWLLNIYEYVSALKTAKNHPQKYKTPKNEK